MILKEMPSSQKPRERLKNFGTKSLSTIELLATVLGTGNKNADVLTLASQTLLLLEKESYLPSYQQLEKLCGPVKTCQILAVLELRKRLTLSKSNEIMLDTAKSVYSQFKNHFTDSFREELCVVFLDTKLRLIDFERIFLGTLNSVNVHPREIFHLAMKKMAYAIILIHNHPSGDPSPSDADLEITKRIEQIGTMVGIEVLDHIIIGKDSFWSYAQTT